MRANKMKFPKLKKWSLLFYDASMNKFIEPKMQQMISSIPHEHWEHLKHQRTLNRCWRLITTWKDMLCDNLPPALCLWKPVKAVPWSKSCNYLPRSLTNSQFWTIKLWTKTTQRQILERNSSQHVENRTKKTIFCCCCFSLSRLQNIAHALCFH